MADKASTIGKAYVQILPSTEGIASQMTAQLGGEMQSAGDKAGTLMGGAMSGSLLSALSGIGSRIADVMKTAVSELTSFVSDSVNVGSDFDSAMSQISATMGMTTADIEKNIGGAGDTFDMLREKAKEMGAATNFSATQAAEGLNILAMSGYDAKNSVDMIEDVLHLAAAGGMDMATAAADISGAMKGFSDEAKDSAYYADLMAKGATLANTNVTQLGQALSGAAAQGKAYSQDAEDVTLALLRLAEQGETGSNASTMLAAAMKNLYTPTTDALRAMHELGFTAYETLEDGSVAAKDVNTAINELNAAITEAATVDGKLNEELANMYVNQVFGIQGQEAYNKMIVTSTEKQEEWAAALSDSTGEAAKQYDTMTDNLAGDIDMWNSALEGFRIEISDRVMPTVREFVKFGTSGLSRLTDAFSKGGIEGAADEFGKILGELSEKINTLLPTVFDVFGRLAVGASEAFAAALPQFAEGIAAVMPRLVTAFGVIGDALIQTLPILIDAAVTLMGELAAALPDILPAVAEAILGALPPLIEGITDVLPLLIDTVIQVVDRIAALLPEILPELFTAVVNAIPLLAQAVAENLPAVIQTLTDVVNAVAKVIPDILPVLMPALTDGLCALVEGLAAAAETLPELVGAVIDISMVIIDTILDNQELFLDCGVKVMKAMGKALINHFPEFTESLGKLFVKIVNVLAGWFPKLLNTGKKLWAHIADGFSEGWDGFVSDMTEWGDSVIEACEDIGEEMADFWGGLWDDMVALGGNLVKGIVQGLADGWNECVDKISEFRDTVAETLCDAFGIHSPSKVMEEQVGKYLALGIGTGFDKEIGDVSRMIGGEVSSMMTDITGTGSLEVIAGEGYEQALSTAPVADTAAGYTASSGNDPAPAPTVLQFVINGRTFAEATVGDFNDLLGTQTVFDMGGYAR